MTTTVQRRATQAGSAFDPTDAAFRRNPYPRYAELRADDELHVAMDGALFLSRYADVLAAVRDRRLSSNPKHATSGRRAERGSLFDSLGDQTLQIMLVADQPDHTRLRRLANRAFTVRAVERLRPRIDELVAGLLDGLSASDAPDVMRDLAEPLPVMVICELLGVPVEDQEQFKPWSSQIARIIDPDVTQEMMTAAVPALFGFIQYFGELIEKWRGDLGDDVLSGLIAAEEDGESLSRPELFAMVMLLFIAGHETTTNLIGNGTLALLRNPDEFAKLCRDPGLAVGGTEELLRYDSPVQLTARTAMEDVDLHGIPIAAGESVICGLAAGNRDPRFVDEPERLILDREPPMHLCFSNGMHHCLGAPLARLEGQIIFRQLAERFPKMTMATEDPPYRDHFILRGLSALPVSLG